MRAEDESISKPPDEATAHEAANATEQRIANEEKSGERVAAVETVASVESVEGVEPVQIADDDDVAADINYLDDQPAPRKNHTGMKIVAIVILAILVIVVFVTGIRAHNDHQAVHEAAYNACTSKQSESNTYNTALKEAIANAQEYTSYTSAQVADPNTLNDLQVALTAAQNIAPAPACDASLSADELEHRTLIIDYYNSDMQNAANALNFAAKSVRASHSELINLKQS